MVMQVNQELCAGCGVCVNLCPEGAIQMVDQRAVIDDALCTACEACIAACPNEAIYPRYTLEPVGAIMAVPVPDSQPFPVRQQSAILKPAAPPRGLVPLAGAAPAYLGREAAPRLIDVLVSALERRLAQPTAPAATPLTHHAKSIASKNKSKQRQVRYRGGRTANRNSKERR